MYLSSIIIKRHALNLLVYLIIWKTVENWLFTFLTHTIINIIYQLIIK
jgi:hypothetical protein